MDAHEVANPVLALEPIGEVRPLTNQPAVLIEAGSRVRPATLGKRVILAHLGQVLHKVSDALLGPLTICHAMNPKRDAFTTLVHSGAIPLGHTDTSRQPAHQVVMNGPALLKLSDPNVSAPMTIANTPAPITFCSLGNVVGLPVIHATIGQRDKPRLIPTMTGSDHVVKVAAKPYGMAEPLDPRQVQVVTIEGHIESLTVGAVLVRTCF